MKQLSGCLWIANWMAAFILLYGSALQSLQSCCHMRGRCRVGDPHSAIAMCNPALRSTTPAAVAMSIRKEVKMHILSPGTLDSIPPSWKRFRMLLWHKLSLDDPSNFPSTPFISIDLVITSINTADGCVPFRGTSTDQRAVQTEILWTQDWEMPSVEAEGDRIV